jgi:hypothetical protein
MSEDGSFIFNSDAARLYNSIKTSPKSLSIIYDMLDYYPVISKEDIDNGFINRYFTKQINHANGEITEIDRKTYSRLKNTPMYKVVEIEWKITGPLEDIFGKDADNNKKLVQTGVITANKKATEFAEEEMPGMKYKLMNFKQLWKGSD